MRRIIIILLTLVLLALYGALVLWWARSGLWHVPIAEKNNPQAFMAAVKEKAGKEYVGNLALSLLEDGVVTEEYFITAGRPVDRHSIFQVASLSKYVSTWGIMTLVEDGLIALDSPADNYLTRWHLPETGYDNREVTIRRLLSHTAGLTDGLGYMGFSHPDSLQTIEESLTAASDPAPRASGKVRTGYEPGTSWQYSGGGFTLLQLITEEVSGKTFPEFMDSVLFRPLDMDHSGFVYENLPQTLVDFYDVDSTIAPHYLYTGLAAASLYTSLADLEKFFMAHFNDRVLTQGTIAKMNEPEAYKLGIPIWGLGTILYAPDDHGGHIMGHDGGNRPAINTTFRMNRSAGDGIIILTSGTNRLASALGADWVFWNTGYPDMNFLQQHLTVIVILLIAGWVLITGTVISSARRSR